MKHSKTLMILTLGFTVSSLPALAISGLGDGLQKAPAGLSLQVDDADLLGKRGRGRGRGGSDSSGGGHGGGSDDGSGGSSGGSGKSGGHGGRPRTPGGSGCDDPGDILEHPECSAGSASSGGAFGGTSGATSMQSSVSSVEVSASGNIEIRYTNGWKEELENGRYELKNANNRTVVQRRATAADVARMRAIAGL